MEQLKANLVMKMPDLAELCDVRQENHKRQGAQHTKLC